MLLVIALLCLPFLLVTGAPGGSLRGSHPGEAQFRAANEKIDIYRDGVAFGNCPNALAVATKFSAAFKKLRGVFFEGGKSTGLSVSHHEFLTWCELQETQCVFIVHVPELRRFTDSAKQSLGRVAWVTAQQCLAAQGLGRPDMKVAVGLRGFALYDRVLIGHYAGGISSFTNDLPETITGSHPEEKLFPLFQTSQATAIPED